MRFSLQDVKKSVQRRGGELAVSLHFLRPGELRGEIERLIAYYERMVGQPQRLFSLDEARACVGDYRLAHCLITTLSHWYFWRQRDWAALLQEMEAAPDLPELASPIQLRLALYDYVNAHYQGFLDEQMRVEALRAFAVLYHLSSSALEYLLVVDNEEEALLVREVSQVPGAQEVATLYNQWVFEAALFNASDVNFVIDCNAFVRASQSQSQEVSALSNPGVGTGVGTVIKRLCYLARQLGVYYDLGYEHTLTEQAPSAFLTLTLYGPQEVTGAPQQYGLRLARLCRLLMGYGVSKTEPERARKKAALTHAIVEAEATVHFLQRAYRFVVDANLLQLLPPVEKAGEAAGSSSLNDSVLFDSGIERSFSEAFVALASSQGVDGWQLEREPEPLLLEQGIFIPDFALTRLRQRIYVEILGFWTPSYRERKIQKLQQLQGRTDLLLAIPVESKEAFAVIAADFPIVYYEGQLSATEVLQVVRNHYDDFAERLELIDVAGLRERVGHEGLLPERVCYEALHCYRRSELARAAERVVTAEIAFRAGIGFYHLGWLEQLESFFIEWLHVVHSASLADVVGEMKQHAQLECDNSTFEALLGLWPEVVIRRDSIFEAVVTLAGDELAVAESAVEYGAEMSPVKVAKKQVRERRVNVKKRGEKEAIQGDLWG